MKNKKNVILVLVFGILIILAVFGVSYSYFKSQVEGKSNIDKLVAGKVRLDLTDELSVSKTNIIPGDYIEKELSVANVGDVPTYYKVIWEDLVSTFINGEIVISLECKQYLDTENGVLEAGSCEGVEEQVVAEEDILGPIYIEPNITHKYKIRITFVETGEEQNYNKLQVFSGTVTISGINGNERREWYDYCDSNSQDIKCKIIADNEVYRDDVRSKNVSGNNGIDFSKASSESNGRGLYYTNIESNNEKGVRVYYYRGDVLNNHLLLAGYCFRIVRTNEDGSLRLRYNGTAVNGVCPEKGTAVSIGNSKYNTSSNDNAYVGYMNGESGASSYETTHANTNNSTIKESVDNWYESITNSDKGKITGGIYCGDRSIAEEGIVGGINNGRSGFGSNTTIYSSLSRVAKEEELSGKESVIPVLKCKYNNDKYTLEVERGGEEGKGNNALIYPVGLMSADEMIYAGAVYNSGENNTDTYLYTGETYWTMSPSIYENGAYVMGLSNNGNIESYKVDDSYAVVPVVNLSPKATIESGDGTSDNPYVVAIKYSVAVGTNTITYGTIEPSTMEVEQGMSALFMIEESYGYKYVDNSCKARYEDGQLIVENVNEDITCNVKFEPREYTLSYDSDGGSACESKTVIYNKAVGPLCVTSKSRKDFVGWYLSTDMSIKVTEDTITTGDMSLKAKWVSPTYTLVYNSMGGSECGSKTVTLDEEYGTLCTPVMKGYKFEGWYDSEEGGNRILETDIYTQMENSTIYAHWSLMEFTLTYDNNGGNGCTSKIVTFESKYGELCEPSKTGYTFSGWYTSLNGGEEVTEDTILTEASDQTIYAHYTANKYTLTYNNNGGSGCVSKEITYGYAYGTLCEPSKVGYTFTGWYTSLNGGTQVTASTTTTGNATIYAHWTAKKYTLTYNNNGGSGCTSKEVTYDSEYGELCTPTREYYGFLGWYLSETGNDQVSEYTIYNYTENITLYARWQMLTTCDAIENNLQCSTEDNSKFINYTDSCEFICDDETAGDWRIKFKSSGTLNINMPLYVDIFAVGGGGGGGNPDTCNVSPGNYCARDGSGGGGYTNTYTDIPLEAASYPIVIGSGGAVGSSGGTSYFGTSSTYYANGGKPASGRTGGAGGSGGASGTCCGMNTSVNYYTIWNDHGGSNGGSGASCTSECPYQGSSSGGSGQGTTTCEFGLGTTSGCNTGITSYSHGGGDASTTANSGNGGNRGKSGASGIIILRKKYIKDIVVNDVTIGTYTGAFSIENENTSNWKIKFLSSGVLTLNSELNVDIFAVGGGGGGASGGGGGGYTKTYSDITLSATTYNIVVGDGGGIGTDGQASYLGTSSTYYANGGKASSGGNGGDGGSGGGAYGCKYCSIHDSGCTDWCCGTSKYGDSSGARFGNNASSPSTSGCFYDSSGTGGTGQGYTTCEFEQGNTSGCDEGITEYSRGGVGTSITNNSGNGGNANTAGSSGIVIIRDKR